MEALQALRGIRILSTATIMVETGDLGRFETARQYMGYLGLVPGERSTGNTVRRLGITKAGNGRLREPGRECMDLPTSSPHRQAEALRAREAAHGREGNCLEGADQTVWAVPGFGVARQAAYRGSHRRVRELAGFVWAIGREVKPV